MDTKNVLILEDEIDCMDMLERLINETVSSVTCYKAKSLQEAYVIMHNYVIDAFFIDIMLDPNLTGDASGMNFAEELRGVEKYKFTPIIFVTGVEDSKMYAYKRLRCYDYIEKPYNVSEAKKTISQALCYKTQPEKERVIHFKKDGLLISVVEKDIVYIKSESRILYVCTKNDELSLPYATCDRMMELLDTRLFVQCNRNTIVNWNHIGNIDRVNRYIEILNCESCDKLSVGKKFLQKILEGIVVW